MVAVDEDEGMAPALSEGGRAKLFGKPCALNASAKQALHRSETGHVAGAALPLSALLDPAAPVVDVDGGRLAESIAWLYSAVQTLEERGNILGAHLGRVQGTLEGTLRSWTAVGASDAPAAGGAGDAASGDAGAGAMAPRASGAGAMITCASDASVAALPPQPGSGASELEQRIWRVEKDVRRMLNQVERKHVVEEKLLGMRIDSLKCELEGRPSPNDFESLKVHLARKLDSLEKATREDVALLGSLLHQEGAADRRRVLAQLESFQGRQEAQWELAQSKIQAHVDAWDEKLQQLHDRLHGLDAPGEGRLDALEARLLALEERRGGGASLLRSPMSLQSPSQLAAAAAATATGRPRLSSMASEAGVSSPAASPPAGGCGAEVAEILAAGPPQDLEELAQRLMSLELRVVAGVGGDVALGDLAESAAGCTGVAASSVAGEAGGRSELRLRLERLEAATFGQLGTGLLGSDSLGLSATQPLDAGVTGGTGEECGEQPRGAGGSLLVAVQQMQGEVARQLDDLRSRLRALEDPEGSVVSEEAEVEGGEAPAAGGEAAGGEGGEAAAAAASGAEAARSSPSGRSGGGRSPTARAGAEWRDAVEDRLAQLEEMTGAEVKSRSQQAKGRDRDKKSNAADMHKLRRSIELLAKFVVGSGTGTGGDATGDGADAGAADGEEAPASPSTADPVAWLEKNRHSLARLSIGDRMRKLEGGGGAASPESVARRLHRMEYSMDRVDMDYLSNVKPEMHDLRREQSEIQAELRDQVNKISVAVGCLEACLPKETRKAVQLFKKAAAMEADARPVTPLTLHLEGKILMLEESTQERIATAEDMVTGHVDRVTKIVRDLERKQDLFMETLEGLTGQTFPPRGWMGGSAPASDPGDGSPMSGRHGPGSAPAGSVVDRAPALGGHSGVGSRRPSRDAGVGRDPSATAPAGWSKAKR